MSTSKADWTVLVYIAAHNNLDAWGRQSLEQLQQVGSTSQVKLAALYDGWQGATRYLAGEPGRWAHEETLHSFDSGDPAKLLETAQWAFGQCPAWRYALVLWSHGTAYWNQRDFAKITQQVRGDSAATQPTDRAAAEISLALFRTTLEDILREQSPDERAILFDDGTQHSLDTLQLDKVTQDIQQFIGQPLDLLGMDACLMANRVRHRSSES